MCNSPIVVDLNRDGFALTEAAAGVWFDLHASGELKLWAWTAADDDDAWLVLDRNGNGNIDNGTELFGSVCDQPPVPDGELANGFRGLAVFDAPDRGGNGDTVLDSGDAIFADLRLWQDRNHNGTAEAGELISLDEAGIVRIDLDYRESERRDAHGNVFKFRARAWTSGAPSPVLIYDVFLTSAQ